MGKNKKDNQHSILEILPKIYTDAKEDTIQEKGQGCKLTIDQNLNPLIIKFDNIESGASCDYLAFVNHEKRKVFLIELKSKPNDFQNLKNKYQNTYNRLKQDLKDHFETEIRTIQLILVIKKITPIMADFINRIYIRHRGVKIGIKTVKCNSKLG